MRCILGPLCPPRDSPYGVSGHAGDDAANAEPAAEELAEAGDDRRWAGRRVAPGAGGEHGEEEVAASAQLVLSSHARQSRMTYGVRRSQSTRGPGLLAEP